MLTTKKGHGVAGVVITNRCSHCRVKPEMEKYTADLSAYLDSEGWGAQMRSFAKGSDGLAEICEDDVKKLSYDCLAMQIVLLNLILNDMAETLLGFLIANIFSPD